jgi:hypothetical protein
MGIGILPTDDNIEIKGTSGSLHALLTDTAGDPAITAAGALVTTQSGLPIGGFQKKVFRALRAGHLGGLSLLRANGLLFHDPVDGTAVNTQQWAQTLTTMTVTQAAPGVVTLNAGNSVAATVVAAHTSLARFIKPREGALRLSARVRFDWTASGTTIQIGFGTASATTEQLVDGVCLRVTTSGAIELVYATSSADTVTLSTGVSMGTAPGNVRPTFWYDLDLYWMDDSVRVILWESNGTTATAPILDTTLSYSLAQIRHTSQRALPVLLRILNVTVPATANRLLYSEVAVMQHDIDEGRTLPQAMARAGRNTLLHASTGAQHANYANSAAPASATLSNTAAGYTTLGGQWQFTAVAGGETDYALFAFTVPTGQTLHVSGVRIETFVMGAAVATTPTLLQWFIGRATAATLASNSFRKTLGVQSLPVGAAIGAAASPIDWSADTPLVVESGQILHIGLKMPVGTATPSSIIRGVITVEGWFE